MIWLVLALAFILRVAVNNVREYSRADETVYLNYATNGKSFRQIVAEAAPGVPTPFRFAWFQFCRLGRVRTHRDLAWISTLFSALTPVAVYCLADPQYRLVATVLAGSSSIGLAMGRRALQDAAIGFLTVIAFADANAGYLWPAVATMSALLLCKDVAFAFGALPICLLYFLRGGSIAGAAMIGAVPIAVFGLVLLILNRGARGLWGIFLGMIRQESYPYAVDFGQGPLHLYIVEWLILSPLVAIFALRGLGRDPLSLSILLYVLLWSIPRFKNYRFFTGADAVLRVLAAVGLQQVFSGGWLWPAVAVVVISELAIFWKVFLKHDVYDPILYNILRVFKMIP